MTFDHAFNSVTIEIVLWSVMRELYAKYNKVELVDRLKEGDFVYERKIKTLEEEKQSINLNRALRDKELLFDSPEEDEEPRMDSISNEEIESFELFVLIQNVYQF